MKSLTKYLPLCLFAIFIWGFSLADALVPVKDFSEMENRYLTKMPTPTIRNLINGNFTSRFEDFTNDQFIFRDQWITLKSVCESMLGKTENNGIVYGADGYMFEKLISVDDAQIKRNIGYIKDFAGKYPTLDISFSIVPNAYAINPERLPQGLELTNQLARIDELYAEVESFGVDTTDLAVPLSAVSNEYIYYRTDHHWTTRGAYEAYRYVAGGWGRNAVPFEELAFHAVPDFYGTYYSKSKLFSAVPDTIYQYDVSGVSVEIDGVVKDSVYDMAKFETRDKYAAFIHSNNALTVLKNAGAQGSGGTSRILLVKDSYGNCFAPYLAFSYDEVYIVDLRYFSKMSELLTSLEFDNIYILYNFTSFSQDTNIAKLLQ